VKLSSHVMYWRVQLISRSGGKSFNDVTVWIGKQRCTRINWYNDGPSVL